jgi:hypothetical protein
MPFINMVAHKTYFKHNVVHATKVVAILQAQQKE